MNQYVGLDVSLEQTAICVVDETGTMVREARVSSEPEALVAFFHGLGLVVERIGLEACSLAAWLHESLVAAGLPAVCIETRRAKAAMGAMPRYSATCASLSVLTWPSSCWTMAKQAITADWAWSAGYLATSLAKRALVDSEIIDQSLQTRYPACRSRQPRPAACVRGRSRPSTTDARIRAGAI